MTKSWITHLPHILNDTGNIPVGLPAPTFRLAKSICSFVAYATNFEGKDDEEFPPCFIMIEKKRCRGKVFPFLMIEEDNIGWQCKTCGTNGVISGWQGTLWDLTERDELVQ